MTPLQEASDPSTPSSRLVELATHDRKKYLTYDAWIEVVSATIANSNLSAKDAIFLCKNAPSVDVWIPAIAKNPSLPIMIYTGSGAELLNMTRKDVLFGTPFSSDLVLSVSRGNDLARVSSVLFGMLVERLDEKPGDEVQSVVQSISAQWEETGAIRQDDLDAAKEVFDRWKNGLGQDNGKVDAFIKMILEGHSVTDFFLSMDETFESDMEALVFWARWLSELTPAWGALLTTFLTPIGLTP